MGTWYEAAVAAIHKATDTLPADMPLEERVKIVDAAYPFGPREYFPYKKWLQARRHYLVRFGYKPRGSQSTLPLLSPLERAKAAAIRAPTASPSPAETME